MVQAEKLHNSVILGIMLGAASLVGGVIVGSVNTLVVVVGAAAILAFLTMQDVAHAVGNNQDSCHHEAGRNVVAGLRRKKHARSRVSGPSGHLTLMALIAAGMYAAAMASVLMVASRGASSIGVLMILLTAGFIVAAVLYARAIQASMSALAWRCPNSQCKVRHVSERHPWRCPFCMGVNNNASMLQGCTCGDCREQAAGYICPSCAIPMFFDQIGDHAHLATSPAALVIKTETERQLRKKLLQSELEEVAEDEEIQELERLRDQRRERLRAAGKPRDLRDQCRNHTQQRINVLQVYEQEKQAIEDSYSDTLLRRQALADLQDVLLEELDQLRRRDNQDA